MKKIFFIILVLCLPCVSVFAEVRIVEHVSDGDTVILDRGERVRLVGVDAPEIHDSQRNNTNALRFDCDRQVVSQTANTSREYLKKLIEGKRVRLEYETERVDKYARTLAYLYREEDNFFVNEAIVQNGYGWAYLRFPFRYADRFRLVQEQARAKHLGVWSKKGV